MSRTVQPIEKVKGGVPFSIQENRSLYDAAMALLESRYIDMPVVDRNGRVVGMIGEEELLKAMERPSRLEEIMVKEVMVPSPFLIEEGTSLSKARRLIEGNPGHRFPIVREGVLSGTLTRHDLLRLLLGVGFDVLETA